MDKQDSEAYTEKKAQLSSTLTIYGRKPVLEALQNTQLTAERLHLADTNKVGGTLGDILKLANSLSLETHYHSRQALARISKNGKQDQGVALDIHISGFADCREHLAQHNPISGRYIALDNVTNPQNLGLIIRTVCASPCKALILPRKGCARLDSLVIKASAGTLFKAHILWCDSLEQALHDFSAAGADILGLNAHANISLWEYTNSAPQVFVLGNETHGLSKNIEAQCSKQLRIPMENGVESLNVAITAGLLSFLR